jgi:hypothetical protein
MIASKKGIGAHQLQRALEVTYETAWFMEHRIREAMRSGNLAPFGSGRLAALRQAAPAPLRRRATATRSRTASTTRNGR